MVIRFGESLISDGGRVDHTSSREYLQQTGLSTQKSVACGGGDCELLSWHTVSLPLKLFPLGLQKVFENNRKRLAMSDSWGENESRSLRANGRH